MSWDIIYPYSGSFCNVVIVAANAMTDSLISGTFSYILPNGSGRMNGIHYNNICLSFSHEITFEVSII